jgi:hypothetical protein
MPSVNISEKDFDMVACAAMDAQDRGDMSTARNLDKLARKMNAAITSAKITAQFGRALGYQKSEVRWQDMPSIIVRNTTPPA